nr:hypothetical protein CFP56_44147 [Quercus suber]
MEQAILDGLQNLQLTKEEEEGIQIIASSRAKWLEECHLSLFGKVLSDRQQNQRALKSTLRSVWKMGSNLRIVEVGNDILQFNHFVRSRSDDVDLVAEKQARRGDVGNDGQSRRQAASHPGGWDNSAISPSIAETSELTHATRKVLNFEINGSEGDAPRKENLVVGFQKGHMSEEMEVISPIKPIMDFSEYKDNGYLDMGCKNKDIGPKTIGSWKRLAR